MAAISKKVILTSLQTLTHGILIMFFKTPPCNLQFPEVKLLLPNWPKLASLDYYTCPYCLSRTSGGQAGKCGPRRQV